MSTARDPLDESLPAIRSRIFAPAVMAPFADDLAGRIARLTNGPLLEIMADVGTLTQAVVASVSTDMSVIATEQNDALLVFAADKPGTARVSWRQAGPTALSFEDGTFGIVACLFGIAAVADRVTALREARRVLKPDGRLLFTVPAPLHLNPVVTAVHQALGTLFGEAPPRYLASVLHGYGEPELIDDDLTRAGFTDAAYTVVDLPFSGRDAEAVALGYCLGTPLRLELQDRTDGRLGPAVNAVEAALRIRFGAGPIRSTMRGIVVSAAG
ncbi:MAG: class I SAM-dependent methyltransferase [Acetobacteraceae bacterium]|nr:class I SAM-dependent methyltransferase [Pseudomonadota bacterium]